MDWNEPIVYAVKHKDENVRAASRSGGIFSALSDKVLEEKGIVYGCALTDDFQAVHIRAEKAEERDCMRGSKYIQSSMGNIFSMVKEDLEADKEVLFSGTSCQIAGLKSFLKKNYLNLLCVDIVCHGVPSPVVWNKYLEWQERNNDGQVVKVDFRNKKDYGWAEHVETLIIEKSDKNIVKVDSRVFTKLFYSHMMLRPCCYKCPYKSVEHPGDITIADYWGIDKAAPGFSDNKGVSLVLVNNEFGLKRFNEVGGRVEYKLTKLADSLQPPLIEPFARPIDREKFWDVFYSKPFKKIAKKYGGLGIKDRIIEFLRKIKHKILN